MKTLLATWMLLLVPTFAQAQSIKNLPTLPKAGLGFKGSVGAGFADFKTVSPATDFKLERGTYVNGSLERGFNVLHLYLNVGLSFMDAEGIANYDYTNLSSTRSYSADDVSFRAQMYEINLGLKLKIIDDYWFRPYVEGGGIGSYNTVTYGSAVKDFATIGTDYKTKDVIMGSGYYVEAGIEVMFTDKFGLKMAARQSTIQTKKLETLENRGVNLQNEIYYLSALFGM